MKLLKVLLIGLLLSQVALFSRDIPPMPSIGFKEKKRKALRECKVPPQIAILPPQIDADYKTCVNGYYEPDPVNVTAKVKQIDGDDIKVISTKSAEGYIRAYEVTYESKEIDNSFFAFGKKRIVTKKILCDDSLNNCYKVEKIKIPKKKEKDLK